LVPPAKKKVLGVSKNIHRALLENLPQKIFFKDRNSVYIFCNENFARDLKIKPVEIIGKTDYEFYPKDLAEKYRADDARIMRSGKTEDIEEEYIQEGKRVFVHMVKTPVKNESGKIIGILVIFWDITERMRMEQLIKDSEQKYRNIFKNANDLIQRCSPDGTVVEVNNKWLKTLGYSKKDIGKVNLKQIIHPDHWEFCLEQFKQVMSGKAVSNIETVFLTKRGKEISLEVNANPLFDEKGKIISTLGVFRDITERKRAEEKLKTAQEYTQSLIDSSLDMIISVDSDRRIVEFNLAAQKTLGYSKAEVLSKHVDLLYADSAEGLKVHQMTQQTGQFTGEIVNQRKNGETFPALLTASAVQDANGKFLGAMGVSRDITKLKKAEEEIIVGKKKLEEIMENMIDSVTLLDLNGKFTSVNKAWVKLTGYKLNEIIGKMPTKFLAKREWAKNLAAIKEAFRKRGVRNFETIVLTKKGQEIPISLNAEVMKDSKGKPIGQIVSIRDITERKKAGEEKERLLHNLGGRVKELHCLYGLSKLVETPAISLEGILRGMVDLIPPAWQYPDITCARIIFEDEEFKTANFQITKWKLSADIKIYGKKVGAVEVYYLKERPKTDQGLFLKEERNLIIAISERLGRIAERMQAEEELEAERKKLETYIENMIDGVVISDLEGNIVEINKACLKLLGYRRREEVIGQLTIIDSIPQKDIPQIYALLKEIIRKGFVRNSEITVLTKKKKEIPILLSATLIKDPTGKPTSVFTIFKDITELKKAGEELKKRTERLERFHNVTVGRELAMIQLKEEINTLLKKLGQPKKYGTPGKIKKEG